MGHIQYPKYPPGKRWKEVVGLISGGAGIPQIATATARALADGFQLAALDPALRHAVWLLARLPRAAKSDDFPAALRRLGLDVAEPPGILDLTAAVSAAVDARRPRTDVSELAHAAVSEVLNEAIGTETRSLFDTTPTEVQRAVAGFDTPVRFSALARQFFARFAAKLLEFYLGREVGRHLGDGHRFRTTAAHADFRRSLADHCALSANVIDDLAHDWYSKRRFETGGEIPEGAAGWLAEHALEKLGRVLKREAA